MTEQNNQEKETVVCATCKKENTHVFSAETGQAYGCSSDLVQKDGKIFSYSHYGSKFDMTKFNFKELANFKLGNICDECIDKAISSSIASEDDDFVYFEAC